MLTNLSNLGGGTWTLFVFGVVTVLVAVIVKQAARHQHRDGDSPMWGFISLGGPVFALAVISIAGDAGDTVLSHEGAEDFAMTLLLSGLAVGLAASLLGLSLKWYRAPVGAAIAAGVTNVILSIVMYFSGTMAIVGK